MITGGHVAMVRVRFAVPVPLLLVARNATEDVADVVGVPEIKPVAELTERPLGRLVAPKLVGELVAVIW